MLVSRDVISDEAWAVLGPLCPAVKATGRPPVDRRTVVEATPNALPLIRYESGGRYEGYRYVNEEVADVAGFFVTQL